MEYVTVTEMEYVTVTVMEYGVTYYHDQLLP